MRYIFYHYNEYGTLVFDYYDDETHVSQSYVFYTLKQAVRNFIREVILYKDKVVITFNFTDQHITKKRLPDSIEEVERTAKQAEKSASKNKSGVYKNASTPPKNAVKPQQKPQGFPCGFCF